MLRFVRVNNHFSDTLRNNPPLFWAAGPDVIPVAKAALGGLTSGFKELYSFSSLLLSKSVIVVLPMAP